MSSGTSPGVHPESETGKVSPAGQTGAGNGELKGSKTEGDRVLASGGGAVEPGRERPGRGPGPGSGPAGVGALAGPAELWRRAWGQAAEARSRAEERSGEAKAGLGGKKYWRWIFCKVPCTKSRRDARRAEAVARRHLRPDPGSDASARQFECSTDVSVVVGEPGGILPQFPANQSGGRRDDGACGGTEGGVGASAVLRVPPDRAGAREAGHDSEPQAGAADTAGRQPAGVAATAVCGDHRFEPQAGSSGESGAATETDWGGPIVGGRY